MQTASLRFGAKLTGGTGFPCHDAIDHIGYSGHYIERIKCRRKHLTEQHNNAAHYSDSGYDICNTMLKIHVITNV
jgi:hypothetical protein